MQHLSCQLAQLKSNQGWNIVQIGGSPRCQSKSYPKQNNILGFSRQGLKPLSQPSSETHFSKKRKQKTKSKLRRKRKCKRSEVQKQGQEAAIMSRKSVESRENLLKNCSETLLRIKRQWKISIVQNVAIKLLEQRGWLGMIQVTLNTAAAAQLSRYPIIVRSKYMPKKESPICIMILEFLIPFPLGFLLYRPRKRSIHPTAGKHLDATVVKSSVIRIKPQRTAMAMRQKQPMIQKAMKQRVINLVSKLHRRGSFPIAKWEGNTTVYHYLSESAAPKLQMILCFEQVVFCAKLLITLNSIIYSDFNYQISAVIFVLFPCFSAPNTISSSMRFFVLFVVASLFDFSTFIGSTPVFSY